MSADSESLAKKKTENSMIDEEAETIAQLNGTGPFC